MNEPQEFKVYLDHLRAEHLRIQRNVRKIREALAEHEGKPCATELPEVKDELRCLRAELVQHFREEEGGGCMEEAIAFQPQLAAQVQLIEAQHPQIIGRVDRMLLRLEQAGHVPPICQLQDDLDDLVALLKCHEEAETHVLERGFGVYVDDEPIRMD